MNTHFETKEHYKNFRKAWANAVVDQRANSKIVDRYDGKYGPEGLIRKQGWITSAHQILFNILRDKPIETGFVPVSNLGKLSNGYSINDGLTRALRSLDTIFRYDRSVRKKHKNAKQDILSRSTPNTPNIS